MYDERFPLTYRESRERFRAAAEDAHHAARPIAARGPDGEELTIDTAQIGPSDARHALVVLAGVHGVEGFSSSVLVCEALRRWSHRGLAADTTVLVVHGVNPWGMAWWRRQNESNVDLNRNWRRDQRTPAPNPGYDLMHPLLCPGGTEPPTPRSLLDGSAELIRDHGYDWIRAAVTAGQYTHPDGLYFGGHRTEESTRALADIVASRLGGVDQVVAIDLHTGYGRYGAVSLLDHAPIGSDLDRWTRRHFAGFPIENTGGEAEDDAATRRGRLIDGLAEVVPHATWRALTMEIGTADDTTMILAERAEHWVHFHGDRDDPIHAAIVRHHLTRSAPDDPSWEAAAREHGEAVLDTALAATST